LAGAVKQLQIGFARYVHGRLIVSISSPSSAVVSGGLMGIPGSVIMGIDTPSPHCQRNHLLVSKRRLNRSPGCGDTRVGTPMYQSIIFAIIVYLTPSLLLVALLTCREGFSVRDESADGEQRAYLFDEELRPSRER
jgi:hypothetical protein